MPRASSSARGPWRASPPPTAPGPDPARPPGDRGRRPAQRRRSPPRPAPRASPPPPVRGPRLLGGHGGPRGAGRDARRRGRLLRVAPLSPTQANVTLVLDRREMRASGGGLEASTGARCAGGRYRRAPREGDAALAAQGHQRPLPRLVGRVGPGGAPGGRRPRVLRPFHREGVTLALRSAEAAAESADRFLRGRLVPRCATTNWCGTPPRATSSSPTVWSGGGRPPRPRQRGGEPAGPPPRSRRPPGQHRRRFRSRPHGAGPGIPARPASRLSVNAFIRRVLESPPQDKERP